MKGIYYICFVAMLLALLLSGCKKVSTPDEWKDLKEVADNYSLEDAKRDGYVIIEDLSVTYGEETWQSFVNSSAEKIPCNVRVVHYYTLDDASHYDSEYYESIKDDYPMMFIFEIIYNGETFSESHYEEDRLYQSEYKYLMRYEGEPDTQNATFTSYVRYVLVNDDNVTWDDIMHGMLSSQSAANIPHSQIYTDLAYREENK